MGIGKGALTIGFGMPAVPKGARANTTIRNRNEMHDFESANSSTLEGLGTADVEQQRRVRVPAKKFETIGETSMDNSRKKLNGIKKGNTAGGQRAGGIPLTAKAKKISLMKGGDIFKPASIQLNKTQYIGRFREKIPKANTAANS